MTFDPTEPVQTRDGRSARIICTDVDGPRSIIAVVKVEGGEKAFSYFPNGRRRLDLGSYNDLINVPKKHEIWLNIYADGTESFPTRADADHYAEQHCYIGRRCAGRYDRRPAFRAACARAAQGAAGGRGMRPSEAAADQTVVEREARMVAAVRSLETRRALEIVLSRCKMDDQTASVLRRLLEYERAALSEREP